MNTKSWDEHERDLDLVAKAREGNYNAVVGLLEQGVNIHFMNDAALREASELGRTKIVGLLLEHGADFRTGNHYPLRYGILRGQNDTVRLLLEKYSNEEIALLAEEEGEKPEANKVHGLPFPLEGLQPPAPAMFPPMPREVLKKELVRRKLRKKAQGPVLEI
jgi:hypothetical protein